MGYILRQHEVILWLLHLITTSWLYFYYFSIPSSNSFITLSFLRFCGNSFQTVMTDIVVKVEKSLKVGLDPQPNNIIYLCIIMPWETRNISLFTSSEQFCKMQHLNATSFCWIRSSEHWLLNSLTMSLDKTFKNYSP